MNARFTPPCVVCGDRKPCEPCREAEARSALDHLSHFQQSVGTQGRGSAVASLPIAEAAATSSRSQKFLARVDQVLPTLQSDAARRKFLTAQISGWEERYARFVNSEGESEAVIDPRDPPQAADFLLTITGLEVRRARFAAAEHRARVSA